MTINAQQKRRDWRRGHERYTLTRPLSEKEKHDLTTAMADSLELVNKWQGEVEAYKLRAKESQKKVDLEDANLKELVGDLTRGIITETLTCPIVFNFETGMVTYFHPGTGEEIHSRAMTDKEMQRTFAFDEEAEDRLRLIPVTPQGYNFDMSQRPYQPPKTICPFNQMGRCPEGATNCLAKAKKMMEANGRKKGRKP